MGIGDLQGEDTFSENKSNPVSKVSNPDTGEKGVFFNRYQGMLHNTNLTTPFTTYTNEYFNDYIVKGIEKMLGAQKSKVIKIKNVSDQWRTIFVDRFKCVGGPRTVHSFLPRFKYVK
jgi:hypothetical protein